MNYARIRTNDIANGEGIRTTIFVSGCHIICPGCQNYNIQKFDTGVEFNIDSMYEILNSMHEGISGLSILGGEPMARQNIDNVIDIMKTFKHVHPDKTIWVWTGFKLDFDLDGAETYYEGETFAEEPRFFHREALELIDVLVDGRWEMKNFDRNLLWSGSSNQRVIDVQKTLKENEVVLYSDNRTTS